MTYAAQKYMECTEPTALSQLENEPETASATFVSTAILAALAVASTMALMMGGY